MTACQIVRTGRRRGALAPLVVASALVVARAAIAQPPESPDQAAPTGAGDVSAENEAEAERLFRSAQSAFAERRYADARRALEASLALAPRSATAINLARVLLSVGEPLAADATVEGLLEGRYGELSDERRSEARSLRDEATRQIVTIRIRAEGDGPFVIRVDGARVARIDSAAEHVEEADPGDHVVVVTADDGRTEERTVRLDPGQTRAITIDLGSAPEAADGSASDGGPWLAIGIGLGAAALVAGAIVVAVVVASSHGDTQPRLDPELIYPLVQALTF